MDNRRHIVIILSDIITAPIRHPTGGRTVNRVHPPKGTCRKRHGIVLTVAWVAIAVAGIGEEGGGTTPEKT